MQKAAVMRNMTWHETQEIKIKIEFNLNNLSSVTRYTVAGPLPSIYIPEDVLHTHTQII